jgi:hypothetical protein
MPDYTPELVKIGTHEGWTLFYDPSEDQFTAQKGRKVRTEKYRSDLIHAIDKANATEKREKARVEPCVFTLWDPEAQTETKVEVTSYSAQGLGVKPLSGGPVFHLKLGGYGAGWGKENAFQIIVNGTSTRRLHQAVEGLRRAQEELRIATQVTTTTIKVNRVTGDRTEKYFEEEDRIRKLVNSLNPKSP